MSKNKEGYVIVRRFTQGGAQGIDICGIAKGFETAAKWIDERVSTVGPYCDWELEDLDDEAEEVPRIEVEDLYGEIDSGFMFYDIFGPAELICSYRYRFPSDLGHWTYCSYYVAGVEKV